MILLGLALVLAMHRFSVISSRRTRGWKGRLQQPEVLKVEAKWQIQIPPSLLTLFRSDLVTRSEFYLAPLATDQPNWWYVAHFIPLTCKDVSEWIKITRVPGIPIAINGQKKAYYLSFHELRTGNSPRVLLRLPGPSHTSRDVEVASCIEHLMRFEPKSVSVDGRSVLAR